MGETMKAILFQTLIGIVLFCTSALSQVHISGHIDGNTLHYTVSGLKPNTNYNMVVQSDRPGGQSSQNSKTTDKNGVIRASGTPGNDKIKEGDSITLKVQTKPKNEQVQSKSFQKKRKKNQKDHWYYYIPVIGQVLWLFGA
jgi:hypothetical protein